MSLWTNGDAHVVATGWGVARAEGKTSEISRFSTEGLKRDQDPPPVELLAVLDPDGRSALVRRRGEALQLWTAGEGFSAVEGPMLLDAIAIGEGAVLAVVAGKDRATLHRCKVEGDSVVAGDPIALPKGERLSFASALGDEVEPLWPEEDDDRDENDPPFDPAALSILSPVTGHWPGRVRLSANRCGIALTSTYSGMVALLDPKSLKPQLTLRVRTEEDQLDLFALPVPQGVLLTLVANFRNTEYLLVGPKREVMAHRHKMGKELAWGASSAGLLWSDDKVLVNQQLGSANPFFMALPGLAPKQFGKEEAVVIEASSNADGSRHVLATTPPGSLRPQSWKLVAYDPSAKKLKAENLSMPDFKPPPPPVAKPEKRKRAEGSPVLAMRPDQSTPWRANLKETTALRLQVMNRGGPLAGMYVEVAGNAVAEGLIASEEVTLGGAKGQFEKKGSAFRAEISDAKLDAHFADASRADPAPSIELVVKLRAERPGNGLMTVRVGPLGATGIMGSAMEGRSFVVAPG